MGMGKLRGVRIDYRGKTTAYGGRGQGIDVERELILSHVSG